MAKGLGLAERNAAIVAKFLWNGTRPTKRQYEDSKKHQIPDHYENGQSQNWWVLGVAVRMAYGDHSEAQQAANRLENENLSWGVWGSEQHSLIYWPFHTTGRLVMHKLTSDLRLKTLVERQLSDLFTYCFHALAPDRSSVLMAGMRSAGHEQYNSYELMWLSRTYVEGATVAKKKYWQKQPASFGWMFTNHTKDLISSFASNPIGYPNHGIRVPLHIIEWGPDNKLVYVEHDENGNTVFIGASFYTHGKVLIAPKNHYIRLRGAGPGSYITANYAPGRLFLRYDGPYNEKKGAQPVVYDGPVPVMTKHLIWDEDGIRDVLNPARTGNVVIDTYDSPEPRSGFFKWLKDLFS